MNKLRVFYKLWHKAKSHFVHTLATPYIPITIHYILLIETPPTRRVLHVVDDAQNHVGVAHGALGAGDIARPSHAVRQAGRKL